MEITLFLGEVELSQVKKLPCAAGQFFGRPNWGRIFKQNREKHQGEHVGVFLCGSPVIGEQLSHQHIGDLNGYLAAACTIIGSATSPQTEVAPASAIASGSIAHQRPHHSDANASQVRGSVPIRDP